MRSRLVLTVLLAALLPLALLPTQPTSAQAQSQQLLLGDQTYVEKIQDSRPSLYYPMSEPSGTVAVNYGTLGSAANGAYTGVTLGQPGIGDGGTCPSFDGTNDTGIAYSAAFAAAFSGSTGSMMIWFKVSAVGVWTDAAIRRCAYIATDAGATNSVFISRSATANRMYLVYSAGGTAEVINWNGETTTDWVCAVLIWDKPNNTVSAYRNGIAAGTSGTLGDWVGVPHASYTTFGYEYAGATSRVWSGPLAHLALYNRVLTPGQVALLAIPRGAWLQPDLPPWHIPTLRASNRAPWVRKIDEMYKDSLPPWMNPEEIRMERAN